MKLDREQWAAIAFVVAMFAACVYISAVNGLSEKCPNCGRQEFRTEPGRPVK